MKLTPVNPRHAIELGDAHARPGKRAPHGRELAKATAREVHRISDLQRVLFASSKRALLIVLQGRDAAGKDGTIKEVFSAVNPQGCSVTSFKAPTELELRHDFLWRIHQFVPPKGMIGIFNRSHYEDVLVPRVHGDLSGRRLAERYEHINDFERMLDANGVVIIKFFLHISRDEQKKRLVGRLTDKTKNWKFRAGDLDDRKRWTDFSKAYRGILQHTSTRYAPWFLVPADDKDVRDLLVARVIADALDALELRYPKADPAVVGLKIE